MRKYTASEVGILVGFLMDRARETGNAVSRIDRLCKTDNGRTAGLREQLAYWKHAASYVRKELSLVKQQCDEKAWAEALAERGIDDAV